MAMLQIDRTVARRIRRVLKIAALRASIGKLARRNDGAAAVEFALVAAPFLALVFAIMETAIVFFAGQALETAVADTSRLIMTGQAQTKASRSRNSRTRSARKSMACSIAPTASTWT